MIASPYCLHCEQRVDADRAVIVLVHKAGTPARRQEASWVCSRPECLARLAEAAEEERCALLRPQGIFEPHPRPDGLPAWLLWISHEKARAEAEASGLFEAIYTPYTPTAR